MAMRMYPLNHMEATTDLMRTLLAYKATKEPNLELEAIDKWF